jgi:CRISPR-associated protein Csx10
VSWYQYLPYALTLDSPAIITALGGDPNSSRTLPYISGAAIRGAIAGKLGDPGSDAAKKQEFFDLVLGGRIRYLNAYPLCEGVRAFPVPVSLRREKNKKNNSNTVIVPDLAAYDGYLSPERDLFEAWPEKELAALAESFITIGSARLALIQPEISVRFHHQRDRIKGRAWKDKDGRSHGSLFVFESLDAGQSFEGLLQICVDSKEQCSQIEARIKELLGDSILVGRSRRAGYGGMARIKWGKSRECEVEGAGSEGFRPVKGVLKPGEQFRLLLTSTCIARHPDTGQVDPAAIEKLILDALGNRVKLMRKRWSFETCGSFNRKWRLETPQVLAVAAGSVFVLEAKQVVSFAELCRMENEGIGERKEEGYGRFLFLDAPLKKVYCYRLDKSSSNLAINGDPPQLVAFIEERIVYEQIKRKIKEVAADIAGSAIALPSNSLIGRLRAVLRQEPQEAVETLAVWLQGPDKGLRKPAMDRLERCRVEVGGDRMNLASWLKKVIKKEKVLAWLQAEVITQRYYVGSEKAAWTFLERKSQELSIRLIDVVLAEMALSNKGRCLQ